MLDIHAGWLGGLAHGHPGPGSSVCPLDTALHRFSSFYIQGRDVIPEVPGWELEVPFDPEGAERRYTGQSAWKTVSGPRRPAPPKGEDVWKDTSSVSTLEGLSIRDDNSFVSGQLSRCGQEWRGIMTDYPQASTVLGWVENGVNVESFFQPFSGPFKGERFDSASPPSRFYPNSPTCKDFGSFIARTLEGRIENGSVRLLGKIGECDPPRVVMPITIEPSKPRMCHDERYLNLWIKDSPFSLETLKDVPRLVEGGFEMLSLDDKSGYDHVRLQEDSQTYFGIQFGGYMMVYTTIPFGWTASPYIYQTIGMAATSYLRALGIPNMQYIDDRLVAIHGSSSRRALYAVVEILTRLGYTLSSSKSVFRPSTTIRYLGMMVDSVGQTFTVPDDKREKFRALRESVLERRTVDLKTLQRFVGKCVSFILAVPGASMYTKEMTHAIAVYATKGRAIQVRGPLRTEVAYWRFLDDWDGCLRWRSETHLGMRLASDASEAGYGLVNRDQGDQVVTRDYWLAGDECPIHLKEAEGLLLGLQAMEADLQDRRVDVAVDNMAVVSAWTSGSCKDVRLNSILKEIFQLALRANVDLRLQYIRSEGNPADAPSREISYQEAMLDPARWKEIDTAWGPHTVDLMASDCNAMRDEQGQQLRHFTRYPSARSSGVNCFAQNITAEINPYVYPPFAMVMPILKLLQEQRVRVCTVVLPRLQPTPLREPLVRRHTVATLGVCNKGEIGAVWYPTRKGFQRDGLGARWPLVAHRLSFR